MIVSTSRSALVTAKAYEGLAHSVSFWMWTTIALLGYRCWTKRSKCSARFQHIKTLCKSLDTFVPKAVVCCCRRAKQAGMGRFLMHQAAFTTVSFDTKYNLHRKPFAPNKFYTGNLLRSFALFFPNVPLFAILFHLSLQLFLLPYWVLGSSLPYPNGFTLKLRSGSMIL